MKQTWVLKVSIDCQGCKKKVERILKGVEGVYGTLVDAQHRKVTVTGEVEADTLIKRLARSGKHAELITPEKKKESKNERKADTLAEDPETLFEEDVKIPEAEETKDRAGKQGKKQRRKKKTKEEKQSGGNEVAGFGENEETTVVGSPVSTLQPFDPTAYHGYPVSTLPPLDPTAYYVPPIHHGTGGVIDTMGSNGDEYEEERSGCFIM